jgi:hypothetical protein
MKSIFVRTFFIFALTMLTSMAVSAETPELLPYMTSNIADGATVGFTQPYAIAVDANDNVFFAGTAPAGNVRIYRVEHLTGVVSVFGGGIAKATSPNSTCVAPDTDPAIIPAPWATDTVGHGCAATSANFNGIRGLAVYNGYLYVSDSSANYISKISLSDTPAPGRMYAHEVEPVVGTGSSVWGGDGPRTTSSIKNPYGIAIDANGNVYWGDGGSSGYAVRFYNISTGNVGTVVNYNNNAVPAAGCNTAASGGLSIAAAKNAKTTNPYGMAFDADGNLFFVDKGCYSVRKLAKNPAIGMVDGDSAYSTLIGTGATGSGSGSWYDTNGTPANMGAIRSVASAGGNNLYITDTKAVW